MPRNHELCSAEMLLTGEIVSVIIGYNFKSFCCKCCRVRPSNAMRAVTISYEWSHALQCYCSAVFELLKMIAQSDACEKISVSSRVEEFTSESI